jgi:broad specificity phosphatase PhoE
VPAPDEAGRPPGTAAPVTRVYLVRHGRPAGAETRRFIGHLDVPLAPAGEAEVGALARRLAGSGLGAVYASDLERTRRSAEILGAPHALVPVTVPDLREFAMGRWEGLTAEEIRALDPVAHDAWMADVGRFQFPGGENLAQVAARAWAAFAAIVARHRGERIAVVAHGGSNRAILCRALGLPLDRLLALGQDYAALSVLEERHGRWTLLCLNHREGPA